MLLIYTNRIYTNRIYTNRIYTAIQDRITNYGYCTKFEDQLTE
jgi:hypothetical protein